MKSKGLNFLQFCTVVALLWLTLSVTTSNQSYGTMPIVAPQGTANDQAHVLSTLLPNGIQQVVVVDATGQTMAVYQIDVQGKIQLKSVRRLTWDLQMEHFNGQEPLPRDLREIQP